MPVFFSIVIPSYNRKLLVLKTVESILMQDFKDYEIILVDDGSTDGSFELFQGTYGSTENIRLLRQENKERGAARNAGFQLAKGRYVEFLDSDDRLLPYHLSTLYHEIQDQNYPDFISTKFDFLKDDQRRPSDMQELSAGYYDYRLFLNGNPLACNVCVRRENPGLKLFETDRRYAIKEDWMFFMENLIDQKLYIVDRTTILMLDHEDRSMRADHSTLSQKTFLAAEWIIRKTGISGRDKKQLLRHANYFSAIHAYIDGKRSLVFLYLWRAVLMGGLHMKHCSLAAKAIFGHSLLSRLKRIFRG